MTVIELSSKRVSPDVEEIASFVGSAPPRMFSMLHLPSSPPKAQVTIAPSLLTDRIRTYRAEVETARLLAAGGIAVQRFDYRGFGHSDDYPATSSSMIADMSLAVTRLSEIAGDVPSLAMGISWGGLVAASSSPRDALVLWEPPINGKAYMTQALRAHKIAVMSARAPASQVQGGTEVLGFELSDALRSSADDVDLDAVTPPPHVLWLTNATKLSTSSQRVVEGWRDSGAKVDVATLGTEESWWFIQAGALRGSALVETTVTWIRDSVVS